MNDKSVIVLLSILVGLVLILGVTFTFAHAALFDDYSIPPTPAIKMINTTSGNVTANIYNDFIEFIAGVGMAITPNYADHEFTFTNTGGGLGGEGVSGRLGIWNETSKLNSTSLLVWDFNNNFLNIANGHFLNSTHYNIGTSRILGSMTCSDTQQLQYQASNNTWICVTPTSGEANTASNVGTDTGIFLQKVGVNLEFKSIRAGSNIAFTVYPNEILINATGSGGVTTMESLTNVTDVGCALGQGLTVNSTAFWNCSPGGGNATILNDLGDVIISGSAIDHILQSDGVTYNNKLFKADTDLNTTNSNNISFFTGYNNATGDHTRKIFQAATTTCSGTDKFSSYNNQTGVLTCTIDATGAGGSGIPLPSSKKFGYVYPSDTSPLGFGTLEGAVFGGTESYADDTDGVRISTATGTTAGTDAGVQSANANACHREWNCYLDARVQVNTITGHRMFVGFHSAATLPNSDTTMCDSGSCFGFWTQSGSTIVQNIRNDGDATADETATALTEDTVVHRYEVYAKASTNEFCYKIDSGSEVCFSTEIPAATTDLFRLVVLETSDTTSDAFEYYYV